MANHLGGKSPSSGPLLGGVEWTQLLSWASVGWYVALLFGFWGALIGTGEYRVADLFFIVACVLFCLKLGHVTHILHPSRRVWAFSLGTTVAAALALITLYWSSGKAKEAKQLSAELGNLKLMPDLQSKASRIPELETKVDHLTTSNAMANDTISTKEAEITKLQHEIEMRSHRDLSEVSGEINSNINRFRTDVNTAVGSLLIPSRTLDGKKGVFVTMLASVPVSDVHKFAIMTSRGNRESAMFAQEIRSCFKQAGWTEVPPTPRVITSESPGIFMFVKGASDGDLSNDQLLVAKAFHAIGMRLAAAPEELTDKEKVELYVGLQ